MPSFDRWDVDKEGRCLHLTEGMHTKVHIYLYIFGYCNGLGGNEESWKDLHTKSVTLNSFVAHNRGNHSLCKWKSRELYRGTSSQPDSWESLTLKNQLRAGAFI